ncbi:MAG: penicillin-binding protein 2 [Gemmatimonadetes bacterium]|nr:penicillin-binding protein 2 [Gemmatimonadota bacterium]
MSFHPNDVQRRGRVASGLLAATFLFLLGSFFRTQILQHAQYVLQSEENRLREVPLAAPRGVIYDRRGAIIAENVPGYTVSLLSPREDSLRAALKRLGGTVPINDAESDAVVRRYRRNPNRPAVIFADASFDLVSQLEEHRIEFPGLIIQATPKRYYPDGAAVASLVGYTGEINEGELVSLAAQGYKAGQQIGKAGIEKQYEKRLRGREGVRFVEVDARNRVVKEAGARQDISPDPAQPLYTNIDLDLQKFVVGIFGDSLEGAAVALEPRTGEVLALHSAPSFDPNRFIGGIPLDYWRSLMDDPRRPLANKAIQGRYPPGSTWKLATAVIGLQEGLVKLDDHMPVPCTGGMQYGNRYFKCYDKRGHGSLSLSEAIEKSCDVYFYQLGTKIGIMKLVAGGIALGGRERSGIDLPAEMRPIFPTAPATEYFNRRYGVRGWSSAVSLNLAIGQGENSQTVVNMARFYTALATDGSAARPQVVRAPPDRERIFQLDSVQMAGLRAALAGVVSRGTAAASRIQGIVLAGKTGTAQSGRFKGGAELNHAWFVGFAPADDPKIVVAVMLEFGGHGTRAAHIAAKIIEHYLKATPQQFLSTDGP